MSPLCKFLGRKLLELRKNIEILSLRIWKSVILFIDLFKFSFLNFDSDFNIIFLVFSSGCQLFEHPNLIGSDIQSDCRHDKRQVRRGRSATLQHYK